MVINFARFSSKNRCETQVDQQPNHLASEAWTGLADLTIKSQSPLVDFISFNIFLLHWISVRSVCHHSRGIPQLRCPHSRKTFHATLVYLLNYLLFNEGYLSRSFPKWGQECTVLTTYGILWILTFERPSARYFTVFNFDYDFFKEVQSSKLLFTEIFLITVVLG